MHPRLRRRLILARCTRQRYAGAVRGVASLLDSAQPPLSYPRVRPPVYAPSNEGTHAIVKRRRARHQRGRRAELAGRNRGSGARSGWSRRGVECDAVVAGPGRRLTDGRKETRSDAAEGGPRARGDARYGRHRRPRPRYGALLRLIVRPRAYILASAGGKFFALASGLGPHCAYIVSKDIRVLSATRDMESAYRRTATPACVARNVNNDASIAGSNVDSKDEEKTRFADAAIGQYAERKELCRNSTGRWALRRGCAVYMLACVTITGTSATPSDESTAHR
jgi:hypothetical protein